MLKKKRGYNPLDLKIYTAVPKTDITNYEFNKNKLPYAGMQDDSMLKLSSFPIFFIISLSFWYIYIIARKKEFCKSFYEKYLQKNVC